MLTLVVYAANSGVTPDDPTLAEAVRWSITDAPDVPADPGGTTATMQDGGLLTISDPDTDHRRVYARYDRLAESDDAVFEVCCRVVSTGDSYGVAFGFIDTRKALELALFENQVALYLSDGAATAALDTTDAQHTYRIVKTGSETVHVSVDGAAVIGVAYESLADRTAEFPEHQRQVLATSGAETSEWEIEYAAYAISGAAH